LNCYTGTFKALAGSSICLGCPANSVSAPGSTSLTQCICNGRYNGPDGGPCSLCVPDSATITCGGSCPCSPMTGTSGTIEEGPGVYENRANCWWRITSSVVITWRFTMFETEKCCDRVFIENCPTSTCDTSVVLLSTLRGNVGTFFAIPNFNSVWTSQPASGNSTLQLRFTSDYSLGKEGFSGVWSVPIGETCSSPTSCVANSYYSFAGTVGCQTCTSNSASPAGSMAIEACVCTAGFFGVNGLLLQCILIFSHVSVFSQFMLSSH